MTTILSTYDNTGLRSRCDARCHNAKSTTCQCLCHGRYHGTKRNGTFNEARKKYGQQIIRDARQDAKNAGLNLQINPTALPPAPYLPIIDPADET